MIIVSSLNHAEAAYQQYAPSHVISILDGDEAPVLSFDGLDDEHHLKILENCSRGPDCLDPAKFPRSERLIDFANKWKRESQLTAPLLIHCHQGVARSTAAAYIILCTVESECCEKALADRLRHAAPHAEPNLLLVSEADAALGRDDRMVEAILDLCPCSATVAAPVVTLPVAA